MFTQRIRWIPHIVQNFVSGSNVVYAHMLFEQRLLEQSKFPKRPDIGGRAFVVTDPNPPIHFSDLYTVLEQCAYSRLQYHVGFPPELPIPLCMLTPPLFAASSTHTLLDDSVARAAPEDGGLGYRPPITTAEGLCMQVLEFNRNLEQTGREGMQDGVSSVKEAIEMAAVPAPKKL